MRTFPLVAMLLLSTAASAGDATRAPSDVDERTLTKQHLERYAAPYYSEIRSCYAMYGRRARTATGELSLRLVIHRSGAIHEFAIDAPGVSGVHLRELTRCIRTTIETWHFPVRRDFTTAILPYYFMYLNLPSAGPQLSCWNPNGCPANRRPRRPRNARGQ